MAPAQPARFLEAGVVLWPKVALMVPVGELPLGHPEHIPQQDAPQDCPHAHPMLRLNGATLAKQTHPIMDRVDDVANTEEAGVADDIMARTLTTAIGHAIAMQMHGDGPTTPIRHASHW
eukprot:8809252-Lingulodinium_polyedra.AAC.1